MSDGAAAVIGPVAMSVVVSVGVVAVAVWVVWSLLVEVTCFLLLECHWLSASEWSLPPGWSG